MFQVQATSLQIFIRNNSNSSHRRGYPALSFLTFSIMAILGSLSLLPATLIAKDDPGGAAGINISAPKLISFKPIGENCDDVFAARKSYEQKSNRLLLLLQQPIAAKTTCGFEAKLSNPNKQYRVKSINYYFELKNVQVKAENEEPEKVAEIRTQVSEQREYLDISDLDAKNVFSFNLKNKRSNRSGRVAVENPMTKWSDCKQLQHDLVLRFAPMLADQADAAELRLKKGALSVELEWKDCEP